MKISPTVMVAPLAFYGTPVRRPLINDTYQLSVAEVSQLVSVPSIFRVEVLKNSPSVYTLSVTTVGAPYTVTPNIRDLRFPLATVALMLNDATQPRYFGFFSPLLAGASVEIKNNSIQISIPKNEFFKRHLQVLSHILNHRRVLK